MLGFALFDQITKWLARAFLVPQQPVILIPKVFQLTIAYNTGAAFSMLNEQPQLLTLITSVIFGILLAYGLGRSRFLAGEVPAFALILGGALGNLTDRFLWGKVTDFLDVIAIHYPIFNIADTLIFTGVALLIYAHLRPNPIREDLGEAVQEKEIKPAENIRKSPSFDLYPAEPIAPPSSNAVPANDSGTTNSHEPS
jgi:signal peptidase II